MNMSVILSVAIAALVTESFGLASPSTAHRIVLQQQGDPTQASGAHSSASVRNGSPGASEILNKSKDVKRNKGAKKVVTASKAPKTVGAVQSKKVTKETSNVSPSTASSESKKTDLNNQVNQNPFNSTYSSRPQGTNTAVVTTATAASKKSPFSFKIRDYTALNMAGFDNVGGSDREAYAWDRINFTYALTENISASIMPQFYRTWFGSRDRAQDDSTVGLKQPYSGYLGNTALILTDSKLATFSNGFVMDALLRYDIPTSEVSQRQGSVGETWVGAGISKSVGIVDFKLTEIFRWYMQQYNTSSVFKATTGMGLQNPYARLYSLIDIGINITKKLTLSLETGFLNERRLADPNTGRGEVMIDYFITNPDLGYAFNDYFSLNIGVWETPDMRALTSSYVPLSSDSQNNGEAYLLTTIKF